MKKEKLIAEYQRKIEDCDEICRGLMAARREIRREIRSTGNKDLEFKLTLNTGDQEKEFTRRHLYSKFIKDLENLI